MPFEQLGVPAELRREWPVHWERIDELNETIPHRCWNYTFRNMQEMWSMPARADGWLGAAAGV